MRARRSGISTLVGAVFFVLIVVAMVGILAGAFGTFGNFVEQQHTSNVQQLQQSAASLSVKNVTFGGQYYSTSTTLTGSADTTSQPLLPISNMNFSGGMSGWTTTTSYSLFKDTATVSNSLPANGSSFYELKSVTGNPVTFSLTVTNLDSGLRATYGIARLVLLVDTNFSLSGVIQPAPPLGWSDTVVGNNITWTTPAPNALVGSTPLTLSWSAILPDLNGTFSHTVILSWVSSGSLPNAYVDTGVATVPTIIESPLPVPNPSASTVHLTPAPANAVPGGSSSGYDATALVTASASGPGSLYDHFEPTFNGAPLAAGEQLTSRVGFVNVFTLDAATVADLSTPNYCATNCFLSLGSSLDALSSVPNALVLYSVYIQNNSTGTIFRIPMGSIGGTTVYYVNPTTLNYFGPTGWVYQSLPFNAPASFWQNPSNRGGAYKLVVSATMTFPGATSLSAGYPAQAMIHFDDVGLSLKLPNTAFYGTTPSASPGGMCTSSPSYACVSILTDLNSTQVHGVQIGLNVTGAMANTTVYAYALDSSRLSYNPPLWVQIGAVNIVNNGVINAFVPTPEASSLLNATRYLNLRITAISADANFHLQVKAYAVIQAANEAALTLNVVNSGVQAQHVVALYIAGSNNVGRFDSSLAPPNYFNYWVDGGGTLVVPEAFLWVPDQVYTLTVTTSTGMIFATSFTAPGFGNLPVTGGGNCLNLSGADLAGANLQGANLACANLTGANLAGANLAGANLNGATLTNANLQGTNLGGVSAAGANFAYTQAQGANFQGGQLQNANFSYSNLSGANMQSANTTGANFAGAIITGCNGCP